MPGGDAVSSVAQIGSQGSSRDSSLEACGANRLAQDVELAHAEHAARGEVRRRHRRRARRPSETIWAPVERPSTWSSPYQTPNAAAPSTTDAAVTRTTASPTRTRSTPPTRRRRKKTRKRGADDVHERRRKRDPPDADAVQRDVEHRVQAERADPDQRRQPVRLQPVEAAGQHQHPAVEDEAERERREAPGDDRDVGFGERPALVDEPDDRLGEHGRDDRGRDEEEAICRRPVLTVARNPSRSFCAPQSAREPGRAPSQPRPRTFPAGACRAGRRR